MVRAVIIDDEQHLREMIRNMLADSFPDLEIIDEADSVQRGVEVIDTLKPDLVFLDIEIKGGEGFDILEKVTFKSFRVIFITAFNEFAIKAIKFSAIDYILKPINEKEFIDAVKKALTEIEKPLLQKQIENFLDNYHNIQNKKLVIRTSDDIHIVNVNDIVRCESDNSYTSFYIEGGEKIVVSKSIKEYSDLLSNYGFIRPHQSHLVNLNFVRKLDKRDGGFLIMKDGKEIPVSSRRKQNLLQILNNL
ncbi:MAG: response regulator transcription factor [Chlorobi bacterium]|nr:response regulator transcription factor [Chlorobiota bacterium]